MFFLIPFRMLEFGSANCPLLVYVCSHSSCCTCNLLLGLLVIKVVYSFHNTRLLGDYLWELPKQGKKYLPCFCPGWMVQSGLSHGESSVLRGAAQLPLLPSSVSLSVRVRSLPSHDRRACEGWVFNAM